mmetsp:Transcript_7631/g.8806  ORF Transcript_7631/g.8806 Transcript_7631/m.8806 type:complete len:182 (-) Transcript_7631:89-634(-)|eukprot:CAMPEP_0204649772 /NCGR_PEP_ID=MMETSP0718-20130828/10296_1 /ASSEMBLY_ACC=CAM_ASM_000674 /TAXON_ID=230516 /ORGANISM="Chaetoceros curvisetus" /LENGTH=181 /DNA_ID=CAMNT_0051672967 /DNA_START=116 /DNA_END=661 /DNA_ORIENTATION=-
MPKSSETQDNDPSSIIEIKLQCRELASITLDQSNHDFKESRPSSVSTASSPIPQMINVTSYQDDDASMHENDTQDMKHTDATFGFRTMGELRPHNEINDIICEAKTKPLDYRQDWSVAEPNSLRNLCSSLLMALDDSQHYECIDYVSVCSFDMNSVNGYDWRQETISEWSGDDIDDEGLRI